MAGCSGSHVDRYNLGNIVKLFEELGLVDSVGDEGKLIAYSERLRKRGWEWSVREAANPTQRDESGVGISTLIAITTKQQPTATQHL